MDLTVPEVDIFDIADGSWSTAASTIPTPRSGTTAVALDGDLIVIGGEGGTQTAAHSEVEAFDPGTGEWQALAPLPLGRHGTQATILDGKLHIAAGSGNRGGEPELNDHLVMTPAAIR